MVTGQKRTLLSLLFLLSFFICKGQEEWNVPWTVVGDSSKIKKGEKVVITGTVTYGDTGLPVEGALVSVDYLKHFDHTDKNGRYYVELPVGNYKIYFKTLGSSPQYYRVRALSYGVLDVAIKEGTTQLKEIEISSRPLDTNIKGSLPGLTKLNIVEIKTLPALFGELDIVKSLQLMPGVSSVGEGSSGFNVRGGRVDQNLVLLNDVPIFNASHALGFVSALNQDIIKDFSLYKGNVPATFGGRASSVLEINTRRGDFDKWQFQGGVGPISSRFTAEGPLSSGKTSMIVSGRASYTKWFLKRIDDPDVSNSNAKFYDGYMGISHRFSENSSADFSYYYSRDDFQFSNQFGYEWHNQIVNAKFQTLTNRKASPLTSLSFGNFKNTLFEPSGVEARSRTNAMNYFQLKQLVNYTPNEDHTVVTGIEAIGYFPEDETETGYKGNPAIPFKRVEKNKGAEFAIFLNDDYEISEKFSVMAGLRYSTYTHLGNDTVFLYEPGLPRNNQTRIDSIYHGSTKFIKTYSGLEPRISARYSLSPNKSVKLSYNRMRQYIHLISNTTAPTPIDLWQVSTDYVPPQIADNYSVGYFHNMKDNRWETSAEFFYKDLHNLVEYKNFPTLFLNNHIETELVTGKGRAYGGELFIRRLQGKWTGWLSYTYSQTEVKVQSPFEGESINDGEWFPSNFNKPHNFNLVMNRKLQRTGAFSFTFTYTSGRPFTAVESSYIANGTVVPIYSNRNEYSIPNYVRLDVSVTAGNIVKGFDNSLVFSIYNLFGRDNAYSVFYRRPANNFFIPKPYKLAVLGAAFPSLTYNFKF
ncbi:MAG TPA: TonB-dependent receptor [Chryseosolibacter sp.]